MTWNLTAERRSSTAVMMSPAMSMPQRGDTSGVCDSTANMVRSRDTQGHPAAGAVKRRGLLERLES
ncbi:MAG: hypothetical protein OEX97_13365, partial [Acidimicrobiia bacterium]|nr:hypothetical protein [Acidimicrobiia bacterium]